jgi:hypothetical protein
MGLELFSDVLNWSQDISPQTIQTWESEYLLRAERRRYFTGEIFKEKIESDAPSSDDPELFPIGLNLVKMLCQTQADSLFGAWEENVVTFEPPQNRVVDTADKEASELAQTILRSNNANSQLWELAVDREIYGGSVLKISPAFGSAKVPGFIRWSRIPIDSFYPIWDPDDLDTLLEVYVVVAMTREQAKAKYGYSASKDIVNRVEHWTQTEYTNRLDETPLEEYSGQNPWGFVPYEFIPRLRTTHYYGDSLTEDIIRIQDELNMRVADLGEAVNYNSHPIRYGYNLPKSFNTQNYPVGANILWDLGKTLGASNPPVVGILEAKNPLPTGTFDYIKFVYDWGLTSENTPPIALGLEETSQRTGVSLEVKMYPLIRATSRSRGYFGSGLSRAMAKSAMILDQKDISVDLGGATKRALKKLINRELIPHFASILPRDKAAITDQVQKELATVPPTISLETAVKELGHGTSEVGRIIEMLNDDDLYKRSPGEVQKELLEQQAENTIIQQEKQSVLRQEEQKAKPKGMNAATGNNPNEGGQGAR